MSEDHWHGINSNLHFVDELDKKNQNDPLYKIRPLITHIVAVSQAISPPGQNLTIDESMIRLNGRSKLKVYAFETIKYGFKAYVLTEASTSFMLNWKLHEGKKNTLINIIDELGLHYQKKIILFRWIDFIQQ